MNTPPENSHYAWGASASKQWRGCAGSVAFIAECKEAGLIPDKVDTAYSLEGTEAHNWADRCLKGEILRSDIPESFLEHLGGYLDYAEELKQTHTDPFVMTEAKVPLYYNKSVHGTIDYAVASAKGINILDLKYGVGEKVSAEGNDQLTIYAISLVELLQSQGHVFSKTTPVTMAIYQPRHHSFDGTPEVWTISLVELMLVRGEQILESYLQSKAADASMLTPSYDACRFCDARRVCPTRMGAMFEGIPEEVNPLSPAFDPHEALVLHITDEVRVRVAQKAKEIKAFLDDLNDDSLEMIENGKTIAGLKTIDGGKGNRRWTSEAEVDKLLRKIPAAEKFAPKKLLSPAQIEKVLKKHGTPLEKQNKRFLSRWDALVTQPEGSPKLVLSSDPRPARVTGADNFEDEVAEDDCL